jgi:hypothetical protein
VPQGLVNAGLLLENRQYQHKSRSGVLKSADRSLLHPGVYVLQNVPVAIEVRRELQKMKATCLHNANVCKSLDEQEKYEVWNLLAQVVDMRLTKNNASFDGWGKFGGSAFSQPLVENLLRYYKSLGDVQMLSTIVCVFRKNHKRMLDEPRLKFLPVTQDEQYDSFIRKYSDLLYGWDLLNTRAEVSKHLLRSSPSDVSEGRATEIGLVFSCPRCNGETEPGTNTCRSCQDYAFRCVICSNSVRGHFTVCKR